MTKYLLSTGRVTTSLNEYILDLFRLELSIFPGDIPNSKVGFNFLLTDTKKDELNWEIRSRVGDLVYRMKERFEGITMEVKDITFVDNSRVVVIIDVSGTSDMITIDV